MIIEGLTQSHFYNHYLSLRLLRSNYTTVSSHYPVREMIVAWPVLWFNNDDCFSSGWIRGSPLLHHLQSWHLKSSAVKSLSPMHCLFPTDIVRAVSCTKVRKRICSVPYTLTKLLVEKALFLLFETGIVCRGTIKINHKNKISQSLYRKSVCKYAAKKLT